MAETILNAEGEPTILTTDALQQDIVFTTVDDMVDQQVKSTLEARPDWNRKTKWVQDVEKRAREFFGNYQPGDRLCWFRTGGALSMRAGLVIIRNGRAIHAWIQMMS